MANTPNLDLENIIILDDAKKAYEQIVPEIINKTNRNIVKIDEKSLLKADVTYVDTKVASAVAGSPKGTYATLALLQTAFPTGTTGIYLVTADNNWYYFNGTAWTAGGAYLVSDANQITLIDAGGYFDGANVELALQEVGQDININKTDILTLNTTVGSVAMTTTDQTLKGAINEIVTDIDALDTQQAQVLTNSEAKQQQLASNYLKRIEDYANIISMPNNASGNVDISLGGMSLNNVLPYNRDTWAEWSKTAGVVGDSTGLEIISDGVNYISASLNVNVKPLTKYAILYNVISQTLSTNLAIGSTVYPFPDATVTRNIGNNKAIVTTTSSWTISKFRFYISSPTEPLGNKIKLAPNIRLLELPAGSQIESDFNTMTADQLAVKYPYTKGDSTKNVCGSGKMVFKGKNIFDKNKVTKGYTLTANGEIATASTYFVSDFIKVQSSISYRKTDGDRIVFYDTNKNFISSTYNINPTTPSNCEYIRFSAVLTALDVYQFVKGSTLTPYELYVENTTYFQAKENGIIVENRMLPNLIKDEFYYSKVIGKWKRKQNISGDYVLQASDITAVVAQTNNQRVAITLPVDVAQIYSACIVDGYPEYKTYPYDVASAIGCFYNALGTPSRTIYILKELNTYPTLADARKDKSLGGLVGTIINYQLATPIISYIDSISEPRAYPSGSMSYEPCLWGYASTASTIITDARYPIKAITKVTKLDVIKGKLVETDVTADATISVDLLSLNIANIDVTKSYFYECEIDSQYSANALKVLDVEVDNGIVSHDYLASVADWVLSANEANATMLVCTNAGGGAKIIAPAMDGKMYVINNTCGYSVTVKTVTSTGFVVKNKEKRILIYNGTDFILADNIQEQEDWITPTLLNGWVEFNAYTPVKFRKDSFGRVWVKGQVKGGTAGTVIFTLPSGYLPAQIQDFVSVSGGSIARIAISGAGNITLSAGLTTSLTLDNISFSVS